MADTDIVKDVVTRVAAGIRSYGFSGRVPRLNRQLPSGTVQTVYIGRQAPFRPPSFSIGLSVVPAALIEGWRSVAPYALKAYESARFSTEGLGFGCALSHADGHLDPGIHSPATAMEGERVAETVIEQFARAGIPWLEQWSDPSTVVAQVGDIEAELAGIGFTRAFAASLLELLPSSSPEVVALLDQVFFLLAFWKERDEQARALLSRLPGSPTDHIPKRGDVGLDDWLAERLERASGVHAYESSWPERRQRFLQRLEDRRRDAQRAMDEAHEALGFTSFTPPEGDEAAIRSPRSKATGRRSRG